MKLSVFVFCRFFLKRSIYSVILNVCLSLSRPGSDSLPIILHVSAAAHWTPTLKQKQRIICKLKRTQVCLFPSRVFFRGGGLLHSFSPDFFPPLQHLCPGLGVNTHTHKSFMWIKTPAASLSVFPCRPGRVRTRRQSSGSVGGASTSVVDSRGRSRAKVVSQSQRMYTHPTRHTFSITQLWVLICHTHVSVWSLSASALRSYSMFFCVCVWCFSSATAPWKNNLQSLTNLVYLCKYMHVF